MFGTRKKALSLFTGLLVLAIIIAGFSVIAQDSEGDMEMEPTVYTITLTEYQFTIADMAAGDTLELEAGHPYTLHFIHAGTIEHEVLFGQSAIEIAEGMHLDYEASLLDDVEVGIEGVMGGEDFAIGVSGLIEFELHPGQELSLTFTLPEEKIGEWEMGCFVFLDENATGDNPSQTHWDALMHRAITVVSASE